MIAALLALLLGGVQSPALHEAQARETITAIEVHGNTATSDDDVRRLCGLEVGAPFGPNTLADATAHLEAARKFQRVEVLKRYASIADPSQILVVVIVDEGAVHIEMTGDPAHPTRVVHDRNLKLLFLPVLSHEDGYGFAYGAQFTRRDVAGAQSRLSIPLTWGGDKRAEVDVDKIFGSIATGRLMGGAAVSRRTLPFYDQDDDKERTWVRGERDLLPHLRAGAAAAFEHDAFAGARDTFLQTGADVTLDTRLDPVLPRNAIYARAAVDHFSFSEGSSVGASRLEVDARGYVGLFGQNVLAVRGYRTDSDAPLPPYLKPLLGGLANLRGFAAGTAAGDTLVATSAEVIVPLTSPIEIAKIGVTGFIDAATIYDKGAALSDQSWRRGAGGSVWLAAAFVRVNVAIAHGIGSSTRVHVSANLSF
ncbi:MAG TPA: BamA/TamA family outer membrane protein [Vicinamibacterales bacterium]|nr:BamA/TamA family outer membrane protein [Vicinamibacterales bacterium]